MPTFIALLRGINVGRARRIAMVDLRALFERLGFTQVHTLLNSGNVVFEAPRPQARALAAAIRAGIAAQFGFEMPVVVLSAAELDDIVAANPLRVVATDASRHLVAFFADAAGLQAAQALLARPWADDALAVGSRAAYLWCAAGVIESPLSQAFSRATGEAATARNWATVLKLQAQARTGQNRA